MGVQVLDAVIHDWLEAPPPPPPPLEGPSQQEANSKTNRTKTSMGLMGR